MKRPWIVLVLLTMLLTACGIPREAAHLAAARAASRVPVEDAEVRAALRAQADDWTRLGNLVLQSEVGGIPSGGPSHEKFAALVVQTAALARRQRDLIDANEDDPQTNRAILERLQALWRSADAFLRP